MTSVHVIARVRPESESEKGTKNVIQVVDNTQVILETQRFTFDHVFGPKCTQRELFETIGTPLIQNVFEGYNGTIFAYGQTASGKTHTMLGPDLFDPTHSGIIPRVVSAIFEKISEAESHMEFTVRASFVEIYLERIRDLLEPSRQNLQIREQPNKGIYVENMCETYVNSTQELMELMLFGTENRAQAATGMNEGSSRSHSVFTMKIVQTDTHTGIVRTSKVNLVDLAGSEKVRKTQASGARLDEAKMINLSLSALGNVINALTDEKSQHIPYRDSKLTRMLQESLGGNARTWLVINLSPSSFNAPESLSTLRFGSRAKLIQNRAVVNQVRTVEELEALLAKAEKTIAHLRRQSGGGLGPEIDYQAIQDQIVTLSDAREADAVEMNRLVQEITILSSSLKEKESELNLAQEKIHHLVSENNRLVAMHDEAVLAAELHEKNCKALEATIEVLQNQHRQESEEVESVTTQEVQDLREQLRVAQENSQNKEISSRLQQLVTVHKQLLRKYAGLELSNAERAQLIILKDERIKLLEATVRSKEFSIQTQKEKHDLELEEVKVESQRGQLTRGPSFHKQEKHIVKPLRGGGTVQHV